MKGAEGIFTAERAMHFDAQLHFFSWDEINTAFSVPGVRMPL